MERDRTLGIMFEKIKKIYINTPSGGRVLTERNSIYPPPARSQTTIGRVPPDTIMGEILPDRTDGWAVGRAGGRSGGLFWAALASQM